MSASKKLEKGEGDEHARYKIGDVVLCKVKGFPAWPAIIVEEANLPAAVMTEKPPKRLAYPARFMPTAEYWWASPKELSLLQKLEIQSFVDDPHKKRGELYEGYKIALDPTEWNEKQNQIVQESARLAKEVEEDEDEDQLEESEDEDEGSGKKRKRSTGKIRESADQKRKKAKVENKKKATPKKGGRKVKADENVESEGETEDDTKKRKAPKKAGKKKSDEVVGDSETDKVYDWRHKLQRAFLGETIKEWEMTVYDEYLKAAENYSGMTFQLLRDTKIGKVMKRIAHLKQSGKAIPKDDEYHFTERAHALSEKWQKIVDGGTDQDKPEQDKEHVNGGGAASASPEKAESAAEGTKMDMDKPEQDKEQPPAAVSAEQDKDQASAPALEEPQPVAEEGAKQDEPQVTAAA